MTTEGPMFEPVRKSVRIHRTQEEAFGLFTEHIDRWWPVEIFSRAADEQYGEGVKVERVVFEQRAGGRLYEVTSEGIEGVWADVLTYESPSRIVLAWKPNDRREPPTEVEILFEPAGDETIVRLEHRGWDELGDRAAEAREGHDGGWQLPLERFVAAAG
ncbi:MAG: SRPBCC domain-containing protein [Actinomycetota bacterium]|nr:SRPBCC domain-containing protein [Actinomycetota bacterium]